MYTNLDFNEPFKGRAPFDLRSSVYKVEKIREAQEIEDHTQAFRRRFRDIKQAIATKEELSKNMKEVEDSPTDFKLLEDRTKAIQELFNYHCKLIEI